jgi:uncharacterized membrane protein (UPF0127 family)
MSSNDTPAGRLPQLFRWIRCRCRGMMEKHKRDTGTTCTCGSEDADHATDSRLFEAINISKGVVVAGRVEWAGTSAARRRGLLGREQIECDEGAYIVPTQWIHMFGMQFPIDVAFLDCRGRVLHMCHALEPNRLSPIVWRAEGALELSAGTLLETSTEVGDIIELR